MNITAGNTEIQAQPDVPPPTSTASTPNVGAGAAKKEILPPQLLICEFVGGD